MCKYTFTFMAFSRRFYPKQITISTFVIRKWKKYGVYYVIFLYASFILMVTVVRWASGILVKLDGSEQME